MYVQVTEVYFTASHMKEFCQSNLRNNMEAGIYRVYIEYI